MRGRRPILSAALACALLPGVALAAPAGPAPDPAAPLAILQPATVEVDVPAIDAAGVIVTDVNAGDAVTVTASGLWCMGGTGPEAECGPADGIRWAHPDEPDVLLPSAMIGALLARIGDGGWVAVGSQGTFTAPNGGDLALVFNDRLPFYGDNSGSVHVAVVIRPTRVVKVLQVEYYPLTPDGQDIDISVTGDVGGPYPVVKQHVASTTANLAEALSEGSAYHGYADPATPRELSYVVVERLVHETAVPAIPSTFNPAYPMRADYGSIMADLDICTVVDAREVDEVWIWAYQGPHQLDISESKMSGPYGDISNSYRLDDMPRCSRTYRVYTYNYGRGTAEALEDHGHQIEAELSHVDWHLFRDLFEGANYPPVLGVPGRCGSVHNAPNARFEYDRFNPAEHDSDCASWSPDGLGPLNPVSCADWGCGENGDTDNPARNYMVWWMQNLPGLGNELTYGGRRLRNWWDVYADFDAVMAGGASLLVQPPTAQVSGLPMWTLSTSVGLEWGAVPGTLPVASYDVRERRARWNGGFGGPVLRREATTDEAATLGVTRGATYCYGVLARDTAGTASPWSAETCTAIPLDDRSLTRSAGWTARSGAAYYAGTFLRTWTYGARLTRTGVVARRIALVATTCPTCGSVRVYWNGSLLRRVSLYSAGTVNRKVIGIATFAGARSGTVSIRVASSGRKVVIDGLALRRN